MEITTATSFEKDMYNLLMRNQDLLQTMLHQQSQLMMMNEHTTSNETNVMASKPNSNSLNLNVIPKRSFFPVQILIMQV